MAQPLQARLITKKLMHCIVSMMKVISMSSLHFALLISSLDILPRLAKDCQILFSIINNTFAVTD